MKKTSILAFSLLVVLLLAGCGETKPESDHETFTQKEKQNQEATKVTIEKNQVNNEKPQTVAREKMPEKVTDVIENKQNNINAPVYQNDEYGFKLTFPSGWEDYDVKIEKGNYPKCDDCVSIYFFYKKAHKDLNASVFAISARELNFWNKDQIRCKKEPDPSCSTEKRFLGKNNKYVFDFDLPQDGVPGIDNLIESTKFVKTNFSIINQFVAYDSNKCGKIYERCNFLSQGVGGGDSCCVGLKCDGSTPDKMAGKCIKK